MAAFDDACALVEAALTSGVRQEIVAEIARAKDLRTALLRLRDGMRAHSWKTSARTISLGKTIKTLDARTRDDGFHVLHDWDGKADTVNEDIIPVDVLHYLIDMRGADPVDTTALAILVDYYFLHILALLSLRIWDDGDADENLDRLAHLLEHLQGSDGSGQPFVGNAETLMLIATSHFELHERGYGALLGRARTLNAPHRMTIALGHAASMGSHLRFGFEATYARDTIVMRNDNVADYPWLCFALVTLMREYARLSGQEGQDGQDGRDGRQDGRDGQEGKLAAFAPKALRRASPELAVIESERRRDRIVEAMLNGLSPDARAFVGEPPASLSSCEAERLEFRDLFHRYRSDLVEEFEAYRPSDRHYSPLAFFFNFSHNILKGTVVDALLRSQAWDVSFNDLLTALPREAPIAQSKERLAKTLMGYARANPDTIRGRLMPVIVYDPQAGHQAFAVTMKKLRAES